MSFNTRHCVAVTTIADGSATVYTPVVNGRVLAIEYVKTDFADGVDFNITTEDSLQGVWLATNENVSTTKYPRTAVHGTTGTGLTYDGTRIIAEPIPITNDRLKIVISQGGNTKSGTVYVTIG